MHTPGHTPVLLNECLAALAPRPGGVFVDCTAGLGGHSAALAPHLGSSGTLILNDADPLNLAVAAPRVASAQPGLTLHSLQGNFAELPNRLPGLVPGGIKADMLLADLGFASTQVDDPARGFSFMSDGPLDMRMDPTLPVTAADLVNSLSERELSDLIADLGEDHSARRIAAKLVRERAAQPILTTARLADLVRSAARGAASPGQRKIDPATRTFQALRIAVNDEIGSIEALLGGVLRDAKSLAAGRGGAWLNSGARIAIISFHSLEDRPLKRAMEELIRLGAADLTDGASTATEEELTTNPRARSAKLRAVRLPG